MGRQARVLMYRCLQVAVSGLLLASAHHPLKEEALAQGAHRWTLIVRVTANIFRPGLTLLKVKKVLIIATVRCIGKRCHVNDI